MLIDQINLNNLRVFESVYRNKSMTAAAEELHLTQSGVSQHIKNLEETLEVKLFDRIKKRLVPTDHAKTLYLLSSHNLEQIEQGLWEIKGEDRELAGMVSIGMPVEFGFNILQPLLVKFGQKNPKVRFKLYLGLAPQMNRRILNGDVDFAFVDDFTMDRSIKTQWVYDETLELCASQTYLKDFKPFTHNKSFYEGLNFIGYHENEELLSKWFKHHLKGARPRLNVRSVVADAKVVGRFITANLGAGIIPGHLQERLKKEGFKLHRFTGSGKELKNSIHMAHLEGRTFSPAARSLKEWLENSIH